jgi:UDP:flavonoid glycosyltransferase YjiC (YdhE family)
MHVVLVSVGTDGDIFPYVGVGAVLRERGHSVTLAAAETYESLARHHGIGFKALLSAEENHELFGHRDFWNPRKTAFLSARWGRRFIGRQYQLLSTLLTDDTVLVANPGVFAASLVHEKLGTPWTSLVLQPGIIPSSDAPPVMPGFAFLSRAPRPVWKLFWRGLDLLGDSLVGGELNRLRRSLGLGPMRRIFQNWLSPQLVIGMFPDWYAAPQPDWPSQMRLVGFPVVDGGWKQELAPELRAFCRGGEPPVAFTFGTGMAHPAELFRAAIDACERLGRRGILLTKYRDQLPKELPKSILHCAFAPFHYLFPLCAAVVHHGGIGTVSQALAAGVPQLAQPLCFDQFDNGIRLKRFGVGDSLGGAASGKRMARALSPLLAAEARTACSQWQKRINGTASLIQAAELIESLGSGATLKSSYSTRTD